MFTNSNLAQEITRTIPELRSELHKPECEKSVYKQLDVLSHYVADKAAHEELKDVKQAFYLVDNLYENGSSPIRSAIENVFVYSFTTLLMKAGHNRQRLMALIPITLFTLYMNQVMHPGC